MLQEHSNEALAELENSLKQQQKHNTASHPHI
jgi:hypothetical protein